MSSLSAKDRASLCSFTFSDGRRCLTPRTGKNPRFCFYHAQKEARARTAQKLGKDLAYFFSGDYLSACDLSTALAHLIPAVVRGDVKPKTARTVAYLAQTLLQAIHISQDEYCEAFDTDDWRKSIRNSVNENHAYRFPPAPEQSESPQPQPQPQPVAPAVNCHSERSEESASSSNSSLATHHSPLPQAPQPAPPPHTSLPPTSAEFAKHVLAGLQTGGGQAPQPASTPPSPPAPQPTAQPIPVPQQTHSPIPTQAPPTRAPAPSPTSAHTPKTPASHATPCSPGCHAERSEASHPILTTQPAPSAVPPNQLDKRPRTSPPTPQPARNLDARALHFDHTYRLLIDGKPL
jgi:hypothetical protein